MCYSIAGWQTSEMCGAEMMSPDSDATTRTLHLGIALAEHGQESQITHH